MNSTSTASKAIYCGSGQTVSTSTSHEQAVSSAAGLLGIFGIFDTKQALPSSQLAIVCDEGGCRMSIYAGTEV